MVTRCWQVVTRCCQIVTRCDQEVFWPYRNGKKSVMAWQEWPKKCFGMVGVAKKVCWHGRSDNFVPLSSDKIRAKSARISSVAITIDGWTGAWSDTLAPRRGYGTWDNAHSRLG